MIDRQDKKLLNELQKGIPITPRPFRAIGRRMGLSEGEILDSLKRLKKKGIIRTVRASFDHKKLEYKSTLIAMKVREDKLNRLVKEINLYDGVSHNYVRDHEYNLWFTLIAKSRREIEKTIKKIRGFSGAQEDEICNLPAVDTFKLNVVFELK